MGKHYGFEHLRMKPLPRAFDYGIGAVTEDSLTYTGRPELFAVFQDVRTQAVHTAVFEDTPEGRAALTAQCRIERLLKLVLGHRVQVEAGSKLDFVSGDGAHSDYRRSSVI